MGQFPYQVLLLRYNYKYKCYMWPCNLVRVTHLHSVITRCVRVICCAGLYPSREQVWREHTSPTPFLPLLSPILPSLYVSVLAKLTLILVQLEFTSNFSLGGGLQNSLWLSGLGQSPLPGPVVPVCVLWLGLAPRNQESTSVDSVCMGWYTIIWYSNSVYGLSCIIMVVCIHVSYMLLEYTVLWGLGQRSG